MNRIWCLFELVCAMVGLRFPCLDVLSESELPVPQRSETLRAFQRNSAVTACWMETLRRGSLWGDRAKALVMDDIESVDINTPLDFEFAEFLSARREPLT